MKNDDHISTFYEIESKWYMNTDFYKYFFLGVGKITEIFYSYYYSLIILKNIRLSRGAGFWVALIL